MLTKPFNFLVVCKCCLWLSPSQIKLQKYIKILPYLHFRSRTSTSQKQQGFLWVPPYRGKEGPGRHGWYSWRWWNWRNNWGTNRLWSRSRGRSLPSIHREGDVWSTLPRRFQCCKGWYFWILFHVYISKYKWKHVCRIKTCYSFIFILCMFSLVISLVMLEIFVYN